MLSEDTQDTSVNDQPDTAPVTETTIPTTTKDVASDAPVESTEEVA